MPPDRLPDPLDRRRWFAWVGEVVAIAAMLAAAGSWPAPDTNESHYLAKARHFQDPSWCDGDFFLRTPEAHHVFYRLIGPLAAAVPLERAAWAGRIAGWLAVAVGLQWALAAVIDASGGISWWRVLAAAIWSLALRHAHASGEWVVGGCEGKVFAWAFVLAAAGWFARGRPDLAWLSSGLGAALHPLVGGWGLVACGLAAAATRNFGPRSILPWIGGLAAAAIGIGPALSLSRDVDPADAAVAVRNYVVERLPHHLLVDTFADGLVARHVLAIVLAWTFLRIVRQGPATDRLAAFAAAAVFLALVGCGLSLLVPFADGFALPLLRFYWFRLSDGIVPLLLASTSTLALRQAVHAGIGRGALAAMLGLLAVDLANESRHWPLPWRQVASRADRHVAPAAWEEVCRWVRDNTPREARFLTPRGSATFQWRAERAEVVAWKHVPQDLPGILEWRRRLFDAFAADGTGSLRSLERSTALFGADRVREVARRYDADYCIVPVDCLPVACPPVGATKGDPGKTDASVPAAAAQAREDLPFERLFANEGYIVYRVPR